MTAVFVHGVPDTHRCWDPLRAHLTRRDHVAVSLPGFGCPVPAGFDATKEAYVNWLIGEIEKIGKPVDIVGHDWGCMLTMRVVSLRPDLIRSWAAGDGPIDADYVWHDMAQAWQTPEVGEQVMAGIDGPTMAQGLASVGVPQADAEVAGSHIDDRMKDCILKLYRSAVKAGAEWQPALETIRTPGLVIWGANDPYVDVSFAHRMAERTHAKRTLVFEGVGHWWPNERPREAAEALEAHWASAG